MEAYSNGLDITVQILPLCQISSNFQHITILSSPKLNVESWKASQYTNAPTFLLHPKNCRVKLALSLTI